MPIFSNLLSEETVKIEPGVDGWVTEDDCLLSLGWRKSPLLVSMGATVYHNALLITASTPAPVSMTVETDPPTACTEGHSYKASLWVGQGATSRVHTLGIRFYGADPATPISYTEYENPSLDANYWSLVLAGGQAPAGATTMTLYLTIDSPGDGEVHGVAWPVLLDMRTLGSSTLNYVMDNIPDYMLEEDENVGEPLPYAMTSFVNLMTAQLQDAASDITDWDYTRAVDADDGVAVLSTLSDPETIDYAYLPWLAQLLGVSLDPIGGVGLTPWSYVETLDWAAIEALGSWAALEAAEPTSIDYDSLSRIQVASAFNGIRQGRTDSVKSYMAWFLVSHQDALKEDPSAQPDPTLVTVIKHAFGNPNMVLIYVDTAEDPDIGGATLTYVAEGIMPLGVRCEIAHDWHSGMAHPWVAGGVATVPAPAYISPRQVRVSALSVTAAVSAPVEVGG